AAHDPAEAEKQDAYRTMLDTVRQMQTSLENALSLFKLNTQPLSPTHCSLSTVVGDVLRLLGPTARSNGIELHGPGEDKVFLTADREMLRRIAINLVSNAIKYTPPGGSVRVRILELGGRVHLSVADTGPGVRDEDREKIFTRFYRSVGTDGRARRIPGSGLGLAIAKQAVDLHGGKIWVDSKVGKGSIFHVMLPKERKSHDRA
ncbi:MAG: HAMP domain-containing sensor histidine kinase, partial [Elusimicrobiota bacterium]